MNGDRTFFGIDHIDTRVTNVAAVEAFYDELLPALGLPRKRYAYVDAAGDWHIPAAGEPYNAIEYYEDEAAGRIPRFIGFIEDKAMAPVRTRIAFRAASPDALQQLAPLLEKIGAQNIELSADMENYPALFFEDPAGTKLELCARRAT
jgi:catechol 2,3-dioxygenase-like lactoylglutathione lyase family enzyme